MSDEALPELGGLLGLPEEERLRLALALIERDRTSRWDAGRAAFKLRYPAAPDAMLDTATHHVYGDGPGAVIDFLADAELAIRDPSHPFDVGPSVELLYHVYNWLMFEALLPDARDDLLSSLSDIEAYAQDGDLEGLQRSIDEFRDILEGSRTPPDVGWL